MSVRQKVTVETTEGPTDFIVTVRQLEQRHESAPLLLGGDRTGLMAEIEIAAPDSLAGPTYFLSRLVGEADWIIDAKFSSNGFPLYSHGFGSRVTRARTLPDEICALLDGEAQKLTVARATGRSVPLELAR
ncbi:hypothetical protein STHAL_32065 [Streptomyces halstedii]|uniref:Uncharacterized protein n=1 Tax=Streptomyces halstedii TaxID=1944 RepID=A0ABS6U146_STRHA|nr:hypothetical protein [Streptomyces halstedii]MBV7674084.1 hypothetical protein [Streptomyces halstedii]